MYTPQPGDEGLALLLASIRDYLAEDPAILELLPQGADSIVPEGFLTENTPTPVIMPTMIGDGESAYGNDVQLVRLLIYVLDRGRGYYDIERLMYRMRKRLNDTPAVLEFFTFPPDEPLRVWNINASGSSASTSFPAWKAEGRGLYVFVQVGGLPTSE